MPERAWESMDHLSAAATTAAVAAYRSAVVVTAVVVAGESPNKEQNYNDPYAFVVVEEVTHV